MQFALLRIQAAAQSFGFDAGAFELPEASKTDIEEYAIKFDWNITDDHRAAFRYSKLDQVEPRIPGIGNNSISLSSYWFNQNKSFESYMFELFSDWSDNLSTEFKVSQRDYTAIRNPVSPTRMPQIGIGFGLSSTTWVALARARSIWAPSATATPT